MKRNLVVVGAAVAALVAVLAAVVLIRALRLESRQLAVAPAPSLAIDELAAAERLAGLLRFPTVSGTGDPAHRDAFFALHDYLEDAYPNAHRALTRETISELSLLYTWPGSEPDAAPIVLMAHLDVVPVEAGELDFWSHPPFAGAIADGYVWGRGALDNKNGVAGILEAVELLVNDGFTPRRTIYLAFGHDEEIGGQQGAVAIARRLDEAGVRPHFVLDEGGVLVEGMLPVNGPVALLGVAEKGYLTVELTATGPAGHSSMPSRQTAIGILAAAITRLEAHPFPGKLDGVPREMLTRLAPHMPLSSRIPLANLWLFRPLIERQLEAEAGTDSLLRTTTAPTVLSAGEKENVLPTRARALVNFRIRPGDTADEVLARVARMIQDPRVHAAVLEEANFPPSDPSPVSPMDGPVYELLQATLQKIYPDAVVVPYLLPAATDARHFTHLSDHVYRFAPGRLQPEDLSRIHGIDERIAVADFAAGVHFYHRLITRGAR